MLIILVIVAYNFFNMRKPQTEQEEFARLTLDYPDVKQEPDSANNFNRKRALQSDNNFYANTEFADFFEDVPCKDTYLLYNYFSELKNNQGIRQATIESFAVKLAEEGYFDKGAGF